MPTPKQSTSETGTPMHYSVGAVIERDGKYLLIDRAVPPFGFAGPAGHIDEGESPEQALTREIEEEVGLTITDHALLFEEKLDWNTCSKGVDTHYWYLYRCEVSGELQPNTRETKSADWYTKEEIKSLTLEPIWKYWFEKLNII